MAGFERPLALLLLVLAAPMVYRAVAGGKRMKRVTSLLRGILVVLLVLAVAGPTLTVQKSVHPQPRLTLLVDESRSMGVMDTPELDLEGVEVRRRVIGSGNSSELKQSILSQLEPNTNYVAVSDFQDEEGFSGVAERFNEVNSTLNVLRPSEEKEAAVRIEGPSTTVPGADTRFTVVVSSTGETPEPRVTLDGEAVELEKVGNSRWEFSRSFSSEGVHRLRAAVPVDDRYEANDVYYKTVEVAEKPEIVVIGKSGGLGAYLERFYDVSYSDEVPEDLEDFYAVIAKKDVEGLERYVLRGNGLVYTGDPGRKAMDIVPVKVSGEEAGTGGAKIVLAVDISSSTAEEATVKKSKQIAFNLVELLPFNNRVGAVAYNRDAFLVSNPKPLSLNRESLKDRISRLEPSGPSFHNKGIEGAAELLNGTGNIIWISDGRIGGLGSNEGVPSKTRKAARELEVRLITVAVGEQADRAFLQSVTEEAGGLYMDASESGRLQFVFQAGGAEAGASRIFAVNTRHFITRGVTLSGSATAFDPVATREGAELLVAGTGGRPYLTAWRYGLGRVAAFSGGNKELSQLRRTDPSLLTRSVSWAVGEPKRKEERWLEIESGHSDEAVEVRASYPVKGLKRQGENLYTGEIEPGSRGFHSFAGRTYAYNYNPELSRVGYRDVESVARRTGGEVYTATEKQALREEAVRFSSRTVPTKTSTTNYFLAAALLLFLAEVGYRKWNGRM